MKVSQLFILIADNVIATNGDVNMISADSPVSEKAVRLLRNKFHSYTDQYHFQQGGKKVKSLKAWLKLNSKKEKGS